MLLAVLSIVVKKLSTTSYAILGLLAVRPWSTYELTQQVRKSLATWWPRTERQLYEQPKILVEHGYATAKKELTGRRERTVYSITPSGRRALRKWLGAPSSVYAWQWDLILRIFFAEHGSKEQLVDSLRNMSVELDRANRTDLDDLDEVLAPEYPYAHRAHLFALILKLEEDVFRAIEEWTTWAAAEVESWPDIGGPDDGVAFFRDLLLSYRGDSITRDQ
jgi:DNA-binding PadR family transcriptional regulator